MILLVARKTRKEDNLCTFAYRNDNKWKEKRKGEMRSYTFVSLQQRGGGGGGGGRFLEARGERKERKRKREKYGTHPLTL